MLRRVFPLPRAARVGLLLLAGAAGGWHLDRWQETRFQPGPVSYEYESDDPQIMVLAALALGAVKTEARVQAVMPVEGAAGWLTQNGISLAPPAVEVIGEDAGYSGQAGMRGHVLRLPEPRTYGQAVAAMQRLARTKGCVFAIDDPDVPLIGRSAAEIPVMMTVWTRTHPGKEPRRC